MGANTKYKDSVFSLLFSGPDILRELYSALSGVPLPPDVPVAVNTLRNVLFMDRVNDISFTVGGVLVILIEHQSTINPNMALRMFMYIARVYEKILGDKNLYSGRLLRIPRPEFFVLYNGTDPYPDEQVLKLSSAFEDGASLGLSGTDRPALELEARVININAGRNEALVRKCRALGEYAAFVAKVREYGRGTEDKEAAFKAAIRYCRTHDILKEFLEENAAEVFNMLITEWNLDDAKKVWFAEGREEGFGEGAQNKQLEILTLLEQAESLEDFKRLRVQLKDGGENTRTVQS